MDGRVTADGAGAWGAFAAGEVRGSRLRSHPNRRELPKYPLRSVVF